MPRTTVKRRKPGLWFILAGVSLVFGIVYFLVPAKSLPVFMPGHAAGSTVHLIANAVVSDFATVVFFVAGVAALAANEADRRARADRVGPPSRPIRTVPGEPDRHA